MTASIWSSGSGGPGTSGTSRGIIRLDSPSRRGGGGLTSLPKQKRQHNFPVLTQQEHAQQVQGSRY